MAAKKAKASPEKMSLRLPRAEVMSFGKSLKSLSRVGELGDVTFVFAGGILTITSAWGASTMKYEGNFNGVLVLTGSCFRKLISHYTGSDLKRPWMHGELDVENGELSLETCRLKVRVMK